MSPREMRAKGAMKRAFGIGDEFLEDLGGVAGFALGHQLGAEAGLGGGDGGVGWDLRR